MGDNRPDFYILAAVTSTRFEAIVEGMGRSHVLLSHVLQASNGVITLGSSLRVPLVRLPNLRGGEWATAVDGIPVFSATSLSCFRVLQILVLPSHLMTRNEKSENRKKKKLLCTLSSFSSASGV